MPFAASCTRIAAALAASIALIAAMLAFAPAARADGDPASDVLLGQNVYYPFSPPVSRDVEHALDSATTAAARAGFPIKIALIASPPDLGVIPDLFGKPQRYADFLDQEISYQHKQLLLVVMAAGYGSQGLPPAAHDALGSLRPPAGNGSDDLARAATTAVSILARAAGHPISPGPGGSGSSGGSRLTLVVLVVVAALIAIALGIVTVRRARSVSSA